MAKQTQRLQLLRRIVSFNLDVLGFFEQSRVVYSSAVVFRHIKSAVLGTNWLCDST